MALTSVGSYGTTSFSAASPTLATTTTLNVGDVAVLSLFKSINAATSPGESNEVTSVTDAAGNTWTKVFEYSGGTGYNIIAIFVSNITVQLVATSNITMNFDASASGAAEVWGFTNTGAAVSAAGTPSYSTQTSTNDPDSHSISGLASAERIWWRACQVANSSTNYSDWTATSGFTRTTIITRAGGAGRGMRSEFVIETNTAKTSDPGTASAGAARTNLMVAIGPAAVSSNGDFFAHAA